MYIRDMKTTQGHVSELSACVCHPSDANTFLTAAHDSTCRCVLDRSRSSLRGWSLSSLAVWNPGF